MDWSSAGDLRRRFQIFKQKCELIFDGPLAEKEQDYKVRMLLLWCDDKGLEIYNTSVWDNAADRLRLLPVWQKLEAYTTPRSNQTLARYQLRCLKQGEKTFEEFITDARMLTEDCGYPAATRNEMLRDTVVFGLKSDKVRRDCIAIGNDLTFQQVYDLAKTEESTNTQMDAIAKQDATPDVHAVRSWVPKHKTQSYQQQPPPQQPPPQDQPRTTKPCYKCGGLHPRRQPCPAANSNCNFCSKKGHYEKVCRAKDRRVNEMTQEQSEDEHCAYTLSTISTIGNLSTVTDGERGVNKVYARVVLNDKYAIKLKVDTGSDTCTLTKEDLKKSQLAIKPKQTNCILKKYGGGIIPNFGSANLKITYRDKSTLADFKIVEAPNNPSIMGCRQALELGLITLNVNSIRNIATHPDHKNQRAPGPGTLTKSQVLHDYGDCFDKIGRFPGDKYTIKLIDDPQPVIHAPRSVPVHIMPLYKIELDKMLADGIISPVTEPTDWVNSIVVNIRETPNGKKIRLCLDPKDLNKNIRREHYPNRTLDEILPKLFNKKYFSVVDTKKGYWHVELDEKSSLLTTFNTPFGRYKFNRCPFGTIMSQDAFQPKLDSCVAGIPNVCGIADDLIVSGSTAEEHDIAMIRLLDACRRNNIGLNSEKLQFKQQHVTFFGHTVTDKGVQPSEDKLKTIKDIKAPENIKELLSILGLINYLNRFSTNIAELTAPLRELNKKDICFRWEERHQEALDKIKTELCGAQMLSFYDPDPNTKTILQCDASQKGLGAWIRQVAKNGQENIVAMCSRTLTDTETRYSNIERECLAVKFGLNKFEYYLMGRHTVVETDHSPLEQIFKKNIADVPTRLQNMILWCSRFEVTVRYKPGIKIPVADALSRVCVPNVKPEPRQKEVSFISGIQSPIDIQRIKEETISDATLSQLKDTVFKGWPPLRQQCPQELWDYWNFRCDLVIDDGLVLKGDRLIIPRTLRKEVLEAIHNGHQGESKCILLARESVFWPNISKDIREVVKSCDTCLRYQQAPEKLPLLQPDLPTRPWEKLGTDLFEYKDKRYLMVVDYYSRFPLVRQIPDIRAETVCQAFTAVTTEYGLPSTIQADSGTQFTSEPFKRKCKEAGIDILYSSPYHHQTNSLAERTIGTVKSLWKKADKEGKDKITALWMYRVTPLDNNLPSPYELLFGRKPKTMLPQAKTQLASRHPESDQHLASNQQRQHDQKKYYRAGPDKKPLKPGEAIGIYNTLKKIWEPGQVIKQHGPLEPRTYIVERDDGKTLQRTREHMRPRTTKTPDDSDKLPTTPTSPAIAIEPPTPHPLINTLSPEKQPTNLEKAPHTRIHQTRSGRTTVVPTKYTN